MTAEQEQDDARFEAADRWLDVQLEEQLGGAQAPDLRHRLMASSGEQRAAAAADMAEPRSGSPWLAVAAIVIGIGVVLAVLQWKSQSEQRDEREVNPQDPQQRERVLPKNLEQFQQLVKTSNAVSITAGITSVPNSMRALVEANRTFLREPKDLQLVRDELQTLTELPAAGWIWENEIRIDLPGNRFVSCAVYRYGERRIGVRGLGDFEMTETLRALLVPLIESVESKTRLRAGNVMSREDLLREGEVSIPRDIEELRCRGLTDDDLQLLARFEKLRMLDLSGCNKTIEGKGLRQLLALASLETLKLRYSKCDDASVAVLGTHPTLRELDLSNHQLTGTCMAAFAQSTSLQTLNIGWSAMLTDEGLAAIAKVVSLRTLVLEGRKLGSLTTEGLQQIGSMRNLRSVSLEYLPAAMDEVLPALGALTGLRELNLSSTNVSNVGLAGFHARHAEKPVLPVSELMVLDLSNCKNLQPGVIGEVSQFTFLRELNLARTPLVVVDEKGMRTKDDFADILRLQGLRSLDISGTRLDANAVKNISRLPALKWLDMSFTGDGVDDEALAHLGTATQLEHLELSGCDGFGDAGLRSLGKLSGLTLLGVNVCDGITQEGLDAFRAQNDSCELRLPDRLR